MDTKDAYRITSLPDGRVVLSLADPDIEIPNCGCESCLPHNS